MLMEGGVKLQYEGSKKNKFLPYIFWKEFVDEIYSPCPWNDELAQIEQQLELLT